MSTPIKKVEAYQTIDGVLHSSRQMARQHLANVAMLTLIEHQTANGQDVLNALSGDLAAVQEWVTACRLLERAALGIMPCGKASCGPVEWCGDGCPHPNPNSR